MRVRFLKNCKFCDDGENITSVKAGDVVDISDATALYFGGKINRFREPICVTESGEKIELYSPREGSKFEAFKKERVCASS